MKYWLFPVIIIYVCYMFPVDDKFAASRVKDQVVKACRERDRQKMHKILNQYSLILDQSGVLFLALYPCYLCFFNCLTYWVKVWILLILKVQVGKVWIEAGNVEAGIVQTIVQHGIRWLVMGAATEKLNSKYGIYTWYFFNWDLSLLF